LLAQEPLCNPGSFLFNLLQFLTVTPTGSNAAPAAASIASPSVPTAALWNGSNHKKRKNLLL